MDEAQEAFQETVKTITILGQKISVDTATYIGIGVGIFFVCLILRKLFTKLIVAISLKISKKTKTQFNRKITEAFKGPMGTFFIVIGAYFAIIFFGKAFEYDLKKSILLKRILDSLIIMIISKGFCNLTDEYSWLYEELSEKLNSKLDKIVFSFLAKMVKFIIITLTIIVVLSEWGYNVSGFITGIGIGGAAIAFAAKDALANIIAGFMIIFDKPFSIGDYIRTSNVEGIVEGINFRSTKIRALDKSIIVEPNSTIANGTIINLTRRNSRKLNFTIGLSYSTTKEQMQKCLYEIREMLKKNKNIINDTMHVNFNEFAESSLNIVINCFTNTSDYTKYLKIKEDINFKIMTIVQQCGTSMAFPSTSIYFENPLIKNNETKED
ncbi:mechanosensitive ion channel family protein [Clostridium botulinum]|uniref:Mechanosensitive ion channel protein n=1 Tax=Clostridium botulinum TaxID=1491 RepID=A0A9Q1UXL4_CLOBO|nr:mechanosensitive ion channel family protein [Clostridium botulinum]AEB77168.1 Mechanosensitive ion channel family [Clostridium botulinum BKT015925]KEI00273.1 mechanosensitive ion channel protein [Clostridium botulinum D str. 16868]KEI00436.1 mechanosensitive ion channel protein [Clostridium botulinum C/D str. Sp77]KLU77128.1 mechanosensitive ion channel protein [Clostridium botulinum V891]KOA72935.1 mechanosensitive ion channel protein [Clostridium botulinum]